MYKPPTNIAKRNRGQKSIFLAGSIEMGAAENWQQKLYESLGSDWTIINPRRDDWDSSWTQEFENPQFFQQVVWELTSLEQADLIVMYFDPATKAPISLFEMGLFLRSGKMKVVCPPGFWRKGNVEVACFMYDVPLYDSLEDLLKEMIEQS